MNRVSCEIQNAQEGHGDSSRAIELVGGRIAQSTFHEPLRTVRLRRESVFGIQGWKDCGWPEFHLSEKLCGQVGWICKRWTHTYRY